MVTGSWPGQAGPDQCHVRDLDGAGGNIWGTTRAFFARSTRLCGAAHRLSRTFTAEVAPRPQLTHTSCISDQCDRACLTEVSFSAARNPCASVTALSLAQKCMKKRRGSSMSM